VQPHPDLAGFRLARIGQVHQLQLFEAALGGAGHGFHDAGSGSALQGG
jgi:hypothetical protein